MKINESKNRLRYCVHHAVNNIQAAERTPHGPAFHATKLLTVRLILSVGGSDDSVRGHCSWRPGGNGRCRESSEGIVRLEDERESPFDRVESLLAAGGAATASWCLAHTAQSSSNSTRSGGTGERTGGQARRLQTALESWTWSSISLCTPALYSYQQRYQHGVTYSRNRINI